MTIDLGSPNRQSRPQAPDGSPNRGSLVRWFASYATLTLPQAAGPVAFSLVAVSLIGEASGGAAMILAMTLAQVCGAVPITRLGRTRPTVGYLRLLLIFRALVLALIALCTFIHAPFTWLIVLAALGGSVNGAAYGYLRALLNHLTAAPRLPRALGIAATLNEVTFVFAPVLASGLGSISPVVAMLSIAMLGAAPALLVPRVGDARAEPAMHAQASASVRNPAIVLWLACAAVESSTVAAVEIGAVALALKFGYAPALAILFTVPLCVASVSGGIWISTRNHMASRKGVLAQLSLMSLGSVFVALGSSLPLTIAGAVIIGSVIAPLSTFYSLILDALAPPQRRPEVFALLRAANAVGVIFASAALTLFSLSAALMLLAGTMIVMTATIACAPLAWKKGAQRPAPTEST